MVQFSLKQFTDYRQFKKCCRKYWKRNSVKRYSVFGGKRRVSYWLNPFCFYILSDKNELLKDNAYDNYMFFSDILREDFETIKHKWADLIGEQVVCSQNDVPDIHGLFCGFIIYNNEVALLVDTQDGKYQLSLYMNIEKEV